jgi:hypothetical protein
MANRILRDWTCSDTINEISESAEIFFTRLIMKADDFGRFYGSPKILKAQLFPLKEYAFKSIEKWRNECVSNGLIILYESDGKEYLEIKDFNQRLRLMKSKFPEPKNIVSQMTVNCQSIDGVKGKEEETETESETEVETKQKPKKKDADATEYLSFEKFNNQIVSFYWNEWTEYKQTEHREKFKSIKTEQLAINKLGEMCRYDAEKAKLIIEQSMSNRWKGLFELKKQNNNVTNTETGRTRTLEDQANDMVRAVNGLYSGQNEQNSGNGEYTEDIDHENIE